ncbi:hypothetical protein KIN20_027686 [Parelaphostrongylus tenuis]|uniref:Uncharacterized protein n=1 Tax=Parelaphostrongylus tenuis TaxID=148309 RepID=A0AAD5R0D6_PARTN|nr:hypothetical protein KIN20_027686 [Parelaphostrongylus tenuis]
MLFVNWRCKRRIEAVYTGGNVEWSADGSTLYSMCSNVVKAINLDDDSLSYVIGDTDEAFASLVFAWTIIAADCLLHVITMSSVNFPCLTRLLH